MKNLKLWIKLSLFFIVVSFLFALCSCGTSCKAGYCDAYGSIDNQEIDKV